MRRGLSDPLACRSLGIAQIALLRGDHDELGYVRHSFVGLIKEQDPDQLPGGVATPSDPDDPPQFCRQAAKAGRLEAMVSIVWSKRGTRQDEVVTIGQREPAWRHAPCHHRWDHRQSSIRFRPSPTATMATMWARSTIPRHAVPTSGRMWRRDTAYSSQVASLRRCRPLPPSASLPPSGLTTTTGPRQLISPVTRSHHPR